MADPQAPAPPQPASPATGPVMDVVAPPPGETPLPPTPTAPPAQKPADPEPTQTTTQKPVPKPGVTTAIIATVIIVLGLALLAVIAFLKQK